MRIDDLEPIRPCRHMTLLLSSLVDGDLPSPVRWYARWHSGHCAHCGPALQAMYALRDRLRALNAAEELPLLRPERRQALEQAWAQAEQRQARE